MKNISLCTKRLLLEGLNESHAEAVVNFRSNQAVYKFFKNPRAISLDEHNNWYSNRYLNDDSRMDFVIKLDEDIIGTCGMLDIDTKKGSMEVSYLLADDYQGKGYAKEAVLALMDYGYVAWNIYHFIAVIHKDNLPSIKFIEKLDFKLTNIDGEFVIYEYDRY